MRRALIRLCTLVTLSPSAGLACDEQTLMSCTTKGGTKWIEACLLGEAITYSYGNPRRVPELSLFEPLAAGTYSPWEGFGRYISESLTFRNADYSYRVWTSIDKLSETSRMEGGVTVMQGDNVVSEVTCDPGSVTGMIDIAYDAMTERGYCWDQQRSGWAAGCN